ncbi:MAG TPA: folylpolyglutamate synthase/dihydrofolate synthase family protein [archaeon]|nr:folylpolyglutamate synthase/dihydrofolate synthase family protein [archaeon]
MQMNYSESKKWLDGLPFRMSGFDLQNTHFLLNASQINSLEFKVVHVAGSNGKGSTCAFISQILIEQGYKTGLYTSPHLVEPTERITINGKKIPKSKFAVLANYYRKISQSSGKDFSYFEIVTAMAFNYFKEQKIDILVAEVGLGGRLDCTNVLNGAVNIITSISLEHTQYLGDTIEKIATEKAGIIKPNSVTVISQNSAAKKTIEQICKEKKSNLIETHYFGMERGKFDLIAPKNLKGVEISMNGKFQLENASLAASASIALSKNGTFVSEKSIRAGLKKALWRGRLEIARKKPLVILDAAHNPQGWQVLFEEIKNFKFEKMIFVFGAMQDKDISGLKNIIPPNAQIIITKSKMERAQDPQKIHAQLERGEIIIPAKKAIFTAMKTAGPQDLVLVAGSVALIGLAYEALGIKI